MIKVLLRLISLELSSVLSREIMKQEECAVHLYVVKDWREIILIRQFRFSIYFRNALSLNRLQGKNRDSVIVDSF